MAKKPIIQEQQITRTMEENFMPYAMSVIISRAIPEIDGFKPSHRKLLYTMYKMNLLSGNRTKSANVVGQTMKLNPHGDSAIYETMVRLTEGHQALLHPLVDSKGNFGRQYSRDMAYAASRYTEVKLAKICSEIFADMDKDTIDFVDNYDGSMKEPSLLPVTFPNVLVNPNQGIAVGMASNICSFNLKEICSAAIKLAKSPEADITDVLLAPDFSTGGELIYNKTIIEEIYRTGRGSFKVRAKYRYDKAQNCIDILEIPYTTTVEAIIDKIVELIKSSRVKEISDVRDETDLNGLKVTIDLKRGTDPEKLMKRLFRMTPLEDSFGCNFNILVEGAPMVLGVNDIICEWLRFRRTCLRRSLTFDVNKKSDKLELLQGLTKILLDIDKAIRIVRETEEDALVVPNLMAVFSINQKQAEFVAEIKLRNLNKEYILKRTAEIAELESEIAELKDILEHKEKINELIIKQLKEISKKYGMERKTQIISEDEVEYVEEEEMVEDYPIRLFRTEHGYLKKISLISLRSSGDQKLKDDDTLVQEVETTNRAEVLLFADSGDVYKIKAAEIPDCKASQLGEYIPNLLSMQEGEKVVGMIATTDFEGFVLFCFENGKIAKISLKSYETKLNRKKLTNAYSVASPLIKMLFMREETDLAAISSIGKALVFDSANIAIKTTKSSQGVNVLTAKRGSKMTDVLPASETTFIDTSYYKTKNIPAVGCFIRDEDKGMEQISLEV